MAGSLLALYTVSVALGALASGAVVAAAGARNVLAMGFVVVAGGQLSLLIPGMPTAGLLATATLVGFGIGCFWVASQVILGRRAGLTGAERGFVRHYVAYVVGSAVGAPITGLLAQLFRSAGASRESSLALTFCFGLVAAVAGLAVWRNTREPGHEAQSPNRSRGQCNSQDLCGRNDGGDGEPSSSRPRDNSPWASRRRLPALATTGLALQIPDMLLVTGLALLAPLTPIILARSFHFSAAAIGVVVGALAAAKITGSLAAERAASLFGRHRLVAAMLTCASFSSFLIAPVRVPGLFLLLLFAAVFATGGAWPVLVEGVLARTSPDQRRAMTVAWNVREYFVIALATAGGGWLLGHSAGPAAMFLLASGLLALSAVTSHLVLRRPVHSPGVRVTGLAS